MLLAERSITLSYKAFTATVTDKDTLPLDGEEEEVSKEVPSSTSSSEDENPTAISAFGAVIRQTVGALLSPPKKQDSIIMRAETSTAPADEKTLKCGVTVARKIKMYRYGTVTHLTYGFGTIKYVKQVWVKWTGKKEPTPYEPSELVVVYLN
jgi:hypothetical protein